MGNWWAKHTRSVAKLEVACRTAVCGCIIGSVQCAACGQEVGAVGAAAEMSTRSGQATARPGGRQYGGADCTSLG